MNIITDDRELENGRMGAKNVHYLKKQLNIYIIMKWIAFK